jgi:hypothetical protein
MGSMLAALALANPNFGTIEVVTTKYHDLNQCLAICTGVPGSENGHVKFGSSGGSQHGALGGGPGGHPGDPHHGAFGVRPFAEPTKAPQPGPASDCEYVTLEVPTHGKIGATKTVEPNCDGCYGTIYHYEPTDRPFVTLTTKGSGRLPTVSLKVPDHHCGVCEGTVYICQPTSAPKGSWFQWKAGKKGDAHNTHHHQENEHGPGKHHTGVLSTPEPKHPKESEKATATSKTHKHGKPDKKLPKESGNTLEHSSDFIEVARVKTSASEFLESRKDTPTPLIQIASASIASSDHSTTQENAEPTDTLLLLQQLASSGTSVFLSGRSTTYTAPGDQNTIATSGSQSTTQENAEPTGTLLLLQQLASSGTSVSLSDRSTSSTAPGDETTTEENDIFIAQLEFRTSPSVGDQSTTEDNTNTAPTSSQTTVNSSRPSISTVPADESTVSTTTTTTSTTSHRTFAGISNTITESTTSESPTPTASEIVELTSFDLGKIRALQDYIDTLTTLVENSRDAGNWTFDWSTIVDSTEASSTTPYDWSQLEISLDGTGTTSAPSDLMNFFKLLLMKVGDEYTPEELIGFLKRYIAGSSDDIPSTILDFFNLFFSGRGNFGMGPVEFQSATSELLHFLNLFETDKATIENVPSILLNFLQDYMPDEDTSSDIMNFLNLYLSGNPDDEDIPAELLRFFKAYFPGKGNYIYEPSDLVDFAEVYNSGQATPQNVPPELLSFFRNYSSDNDDQIVPLDLKSNLNLFLADRTTPDNTPPELLNFFKTYFLGYDNSDAIPADWNSFLEQYTTADNDDLPLNWKNFFDIYFTGEDAEETTNFDWSSFFDVFFSDENSGDQSTSPLNKFLDYWFSSKNSDNPLLNWDEFNDKYYPGSDAGSAPSDWKSLFDFGSATTADPQDLKSTVSGWLQEYGSSVGGTSGLKANLLDLYNVEDGLNVSGEVLDGAVTELEKNGLTSTADVSNDRLVEIKDALNKAGIHSIVDGGGLKGFENLGLALGLAKGVPLLSEKIVTDAMDEPQCKGLNLAVACLMGQIIEESGVDTADVVQHLKEELPDIFGSRK